MGASCLAGSSVAGFANNFAPGPRYLAAKLSWGWSLPAKVADDNVCGAGIRGVLGCPVLQSESLDCLNDLSYGTTTRDSLHWFVKAKPYVVARLDSTPLDEIGIVDTHYSTLYIITIVIGTIAREPLQLEDSAQQNYAEESKFMFGRRPRPESRAQETSLDFSLDEQRHKSTIGRVISPISLQLPTATAPPGLKEFAVLRFPPWLLRPGPTGVAIRIPKTA